MEDLNLKPCPFCGSEAQLEYCGTSRCFRMHTAKVECSACGVIGDSGGSFKSGEDAECDAINKWNTRASGWISVDNALPESDCECLCYSKNTLSGETCLNVFHFVYIANTFCRRFGVEVTHWMPLPKPPEVKHG